MELYKYNDIMPFLELVHPFLKDTNNTGKCIEIRAINRINKKDVSSCNLWNSTSGAAYLQKYLGNISFKPACVYYSVFSFVRKNKEKNINSSNSFSTQILVADFDNISKENINKYYQKLKKIGVESILINSGNGYQIIILLEREIKNKQILRSFNNLLYKKGFPVDLSISASAQIMRLPYTYNCKEFDKENKKFSNNPTKKITFIEEYTERRYTCSEIFSLVNTLPTVKITKKDKKAKEVVDLSNDDYLSLISEQEWDSFAMPIRNILTSCEKGYRNNALITLTTYFRNRGYSNEKIKAFVKIWTKHTTPNLDIDFAIAETSRLLNYHYSSIEKFYTYNMVERFGPLEIDFKIKNKEALFISNEIFKSYKNIKPTTVKIYLYMVYKYATTGCGITRDDCIKELGVSIATLNRHLKQMEKHRLVIIKQSYKKDCVQYIYTPINNLNNKKCGYTVIEYSKVADILFGKYNKLTSSEIKVLLYMYSKMNITNRTWESQATIGKNTGFNSTSICIITNRLTNKAYINKQQLLTFFKDKEKHNIIEKLDKHLYHFIINELKPSINKWNTNCIYWVQEFLEKNILDTVQI